MYLLKQASVVKMFSARNTVVFPRLDEKLIYYLENELPPPDADRNGNLRRKTSLQPPPASAGGQKAGGTGKAGKAGKGALPAE